MSIRYRVWLQSGAEQRSGSEGGMEAELDADQITYSREDGRWELIPVGYIRCLVGILTEYDTHRPSRATKMIIGALNELRNSNDVE